MPTMKNSGDLLSSIASDLADNNAGLISAEDVRHNLEDTVYSINRIVCSGDTKVDFPFYNVVKITNQRATDLGEVPQDSATYGDLIVESGIFFPNAPVNESKRQTEPWLGEQGINHNNIDNLTVGDPHTQYYALNGARSLTANFKAGNNWVNASGYNDTGFKFEANGVGNQTILTSGKMQFGDGSVINNTVDNMAKAWVQFRANNGSNVPEVITYHNISGVYRIAEGKFEVHLASGLFKDAGGADTPHFVAIGTANGTTTAASYEDGTVNTVITALRQRIDSNPGRHACSVVVRTETGDYSDSELIDVVFYGLGQGVTAGPAPATASVSSGSF